MTASLLLTWFACTHAPAPQAAPQPPQPLDAMIATALRDPDTPLPFDPSVTQGTLDNGLSYLIEHRERPAGRAELRLVVLAGSLQEDDDQRGLAHLVEHMAFNGSEHFEGNSLVAALELMGLEFGAHLNAQTSYDHTLYQLSVPTDDHSIMDTALLVMQDWAGGVVMTDEEVEKERGVVLEEWRRSRGATQRSSDAFRDLLFAGSRYADRPPIGTEESLRTFDPDALRRFYADWYRPDLMTLIVVGDVDPQQLQDAIRERFADLQMPRHPRTRELPTLPDFDHTRFQVQADPELSAAQFAVSSVIEDPQGVTWGDYRELIVQGMASSILNDRLGAVSRTADAPFFGAGEATQRLDPRYSADIVGGASPEDAVVDGLSATLVEVERARRFGATPSELERARVETTRQFADYVAQSDKEPSTQAVAELVRHVVENEAVPGTAAEARYVERMLPQVDLAEINRHLAAILPDHNRIVAVTMPEKPGLELPTEDQLADVLTGVAALQITPPRDTVVDGPLTSETPQPGTILRERTLDAVGVTEWTLSNGAVVLLKPTDFSADQVLYQAHSWGGTSLVPLGDLVPAETATELASASGLGDYDLDDLIQVMAGRRVRLSPVISRYYEGFNGASSQQDLESLFQLIWLSSQRPRFDPTAFELTQRNRMEALKNAEANPAVRFNRAWEDVVWQGNPRMLSWTASTPEAMDLAASQRIYTERLGSAGAMVHVFVGNFDLETMRPLVQTWLASVPAGPAGETWRDVGARAVEGQHRVELRAGTDQKATVHLRLWGQDACTPDHRHALSTMVSVLEMQLNSELREDRGGTYGVTVRSSFVPIPTPTWTILISFDCDPERVDELLAATQDAMARLRTQPVDAAMVMAVAEQLRRSWEVEQRSNDWWLGALMLNRERAEAPAELLRYKTLWQELSPQGVMEAAQRYLDPSNQVIGVRLPEE